MSPDGLEEWIETNVQKTNQQVNTPIRRARQIGTMKKAPRGNVTDKNCCAQEGSDAGQRRTMGKEEMWLADARKGGECNGLLKIGMGEIVKVGPVFMTSAQTMSF